MTKRGLVSPTDFPPTMTKQPGTGTTGHSRSSCPTPATGELIGGLTGRTSFGLLFVERFFLPEKWRRNGLGSRVLASAEAEAKRRGCTRAALFTLTFQAPGFYQKQGDEIAARLDCDPPGATRVLMAKRL